MPEFSVNRSYYACFYALSAVLLHEGFSFKKHSGVRGALHQQFIKTGRLSAELGRFYDRLFENRKRADYQELAVFEREQAEELISEAKSFISEMRKFVS